MEILGNVENGWFAQLAHTCQAVSKTTLNFVSLGNHLGDKLYTGMDAAANSYITDVNEQAISQALAKGATPHQALSVGSAALEPIANPTSVSEVLKLGGHGSSVARKAVDNTIKELIPACGNPASGNIAGMLAPLLIGGAVLSVLYMIIEAIPANVFNRLTANQDRLEARHERIEALALQRDQKRVALARQDVSLGIKPSVLPSIRASRILTFA